MEFKPRPYQKYCIQRMIEEPNLGLFLDMGLGKSVIALTAVKELMHYRFQVRRTLIIAPLKVAEATWDQELKKWDHLEGLTMSLVLGTKKQRLDALKADADIYVTNREQTTWLVNLYKNNWPFDLVIVDESSSFKNYKAKRTKALMAVRPRIKRMVLLTGTPSPKGLEDLWSQVYLLDQGKRLERNITAYRTRYFDTQVMPYARIYTPKQGAAEAILNKISDICITLKSEDYLELPDLIEADLPVLLSDKSKKAYQEMEKKMVLSLPEGDVTAASAAALSTKLLQLAGGAIYDEDGKIHQIHDDKIKAFMELVESLNGESALVFYNYRHELLRLQKALKKTDLNVRALNSPDDITAWNRGEVDLLLAHPASTAYGLNLQEGGRRIIWFGLTWNYEHYTQANKRLHRSGQDKPVIVHRLIAKGTRDEDVKKALEKKEKGQEYVMESLKARIDKYRGGKS